MSVSPSDDRKGASLVPGGSVEEGYVVLPYTKDEFKDFITSLLGSPQAISKRLNGGFEITPDDIRNLHQLIRQRIVQQNDSVLARFTARVGFDDGSSIQLNSLEELLTYNEVRPVVSNALHVRWDWLVKFQDKQVPEKQSIQVSFSPSDGGSRFRLERTIFMEEGLSFGSGSISFRIEYTARTWGADIEALLSNHFQNLIQQEPRVRGFLHRHSSKVSIVTGGIFFSGSLVGALTATQRFSMRRVEEAKSLLVDNEGTDLLALNSKVAYIAQLFAEGIWAQYYFGLAIFLLTSLFVSFGIAAWVDDSLDVRAPSFLLFTKQAYNHREQVEEKHRKRWQSFLVALVTSVLTGVAGNIVFRALFE